MSVICILITAFLCLQAQISMIVSQAVKGQASPRIPKDSTANCREKWQEWREPGICVMPNQVETFISSFCRDVEAAMQQQQAAKLPPLSNIHESPLFVYRKKVKRRRNSRGASVDHSGSANGVLSTYQLDPRINFMNRYLNFMKKLREPDKDDHSGTNGKPPQSNKNVSNGRGEDSANSKLGSDVKPLEESSNNDPLSYVSESCGNCAFQIRCRLRNAADTCGGQNLEVERSDCTKAEASKPCQLPRLVCTMVGTLERIFESSGITETVQQRKLRPYRNHFGSHNSAGRSRSTGRGVANIKWARVVRLNKVERDKTRKRSYKPFDREEKLPQLNCVTDDTRNICQCCCKPSKPFNGSCITPAIDPDIPRNPPPLPLPEKLKESKESKEVEKAKSAENKAGSNEASGERRPNVSSPFEVPEVEKPTEEMKPPLESSQSRQSSQSKVKPQKAKGQSLVPQGAKQSNAHSKEPVEQPLPLPKQEVINSQKQSQSVGAPNNQSSQSIARQPILKQSGQSAQSKRDPLSQQPTKSQAQKPSEQKGSVQLLQQSKQDKPVKHSENLLSGQHLPQTVPSSQAKQSNGKSQSAQQSQKGQSSMKSQVAVQSQKGKQPIGQSKQQLIKPQKQSSQLSQSKAQSTKQTKPEENVPPTDNVGDEKKHSNQAGASPIAPQAKQSKPSSQTAQVAGLPSLIHGKQQSKQEVQVPKNPDPIEVVGKGTETVQPSGSKSEEVVTGHNSGEKHGNVSDNHETPPNSAEIAGHTDGDHLPKSDSKSEASAGLQVVDKNTLDLEDPDSSEDPPNGILPPVNNHLDLKESNEEEDDLPKTNVSPSESNQPSNLSNVSPIESNQPEEVAPPLNGLAIAEGKQQQSVPKQEVAAQQKSDKAVGHQNGSKPAENPQHSQSKQSASKQQSLKHTAKGHQRQIKYYRRN